MLTLPPRVFITGTDTEVGKTYVACKLLELLKQQGKTTAVMKPIASGCEPSDNGLVNEDALALQQAATMELPYSLVNPYAFAEPVAPHIPAMELNTPISIRTLLQNLKEIESMRADHVVVEGAGGWNTPLDNQQTLADFVIVAGLPVILVVGLRLGCINHALLSHEAIIRKGAPFLGWIANCIPPAMPRLQENIDILSEYLEPPMLIV